MVLQALLLNEAYSKFFPDSAQHFHSPSFPMSLDGHPSFSDLANPSQTIFPTYCDRGSLLDAASHEDQALLAPWGSSGHQMRSNAPSCYPLEGPVLHSSPHTAIPAQPDQQPQQLRAPGSAADERAAILDAPMAVATSKGRTIAA